MKCIIDTSVWINHLVTPQQELVDLLRNPGLIVMHPFVLGEIILSNSKKSQLLYKELSKFPSIELSNSLDIEQFVMNNPIRGKGIGLIDVHLIYSCIFHGFKLITHDKRLDHIYQEILEQTP